MNTGLEWTVIVFPVLFFWVIPAFVVASFAKRKGRSYAGFLFFSLVIGWLIPGLIIATVKK